jgi:hypothetical protein
VTPATAGRGSLARWVRNARPRSVVRWGHIRSCGAAKPCRVMVLLQTRAMEGWANSNGSNQTSASRIRWNLGSDGVAIYIYIFFLGMNFVMGLVYVDETVLTVGVGGFSVRVVFC